MTKLMPLLAVGCLLTTGCGDRATEPSDKIEVTGQSVQAKPAPAPAEVQGEPFVATVLGSLDFSIAGAKQVADRGETEGGRALARKMEGEFSAARQELMDIAKSGGLTARAEAAPTFQSDLAILGSTRGKPLEQAFAKQQVDSLTLLVGTVRAYKNGGDNAALKAWADKYSSAIGERLLDVQSLNAELEGNG